MLLAWEEIRRGAAGSRRDGGESGRFHAAAVTGEGAICYDGEEISVWSETVVDWSEIVVENAIAFWNEAATFWSATATFDDEIVIAISVFHQQVCPHQACQHQAWASPQPPRVWACQQHCQWANLLQRYLERLRRVSLLSRPNHLSDWISQPAHHPGDQPPAALVYPGLR